MKKIKYILEAIVLYILFYTLKALPPETSSRTCGYCLQKIGPQLGIARKARKQLTQCFPEKSEKEIKNIEIAMWNHLGRVFGEYPHIKYFVKNKLRYTNDSLIKQLIKDKKPAIIFGAHIGNWELNCAATLLEHNYPIDITYRAMNNPYADKLLYKARTLNSRIKAHPKSRNAALNIIRALKNNHFVGVLLDQKFNEGPEIPFFNMPAKTNPGFVEICQRHNIPLIPAQNIRNNDGTFELKFYKPIALYSDKGEPLPVTAVLGDVNTYIENWVKENPAQWLWLHNRWGTTK